MHKLIYLARQGCVYNFYYRDVLIYFKVVDKFNFFKETFDLSLVCCQTWLFAVLDGIFVFKFYASHVFCCSSSS